MGSFSGGQEQFGKATLLRKSGQVDGASGFRVGFSDGYHPKLDWCSVGS
jgi:hypothetical protein